MRPWPRCHHHVWETRSWQQREVPSEPHAPGRTRFPSLHLIRPQWAAGSRHEQGPPSPAGGSVTRAPRSMLNLGLPWWAGATATHTVPWAELWAVLTGWPAPPDRDAQGNVRTRGTGCSSRPGPQAKSAACTACPTLSLPRGASVLWRRLCRMAHPKPFSQEAVASIALEWCPSQSTDGMGRARVRACGSPLKLFQNCSAPRASQLDGAVPFSSHRGC